MCPCENGCARCRYALKKWQKSWEEEAEEEAARQKAKIEQCGLSQKKSTVYFVDFQSKKFLRKEES